MSPCVHIWGTNALQIVLYPNSIICKPPFCSVCGNLVPWFITEHRKLGVTFLLAQASAILISSLTLLFYHYCIRLESFSNCQEPIWFFMVEKQTSTTSLMKQMFRIGVQGASW